MANNLGYLLLGVLNEAQKKKQQEDEFKKAIRMMMLEAQVKQQFDPEAQFRQQMLSLFGGGQGQPQGQGQQTIPQTANIMGRGQVPISPVNFAQNGMAPQGQPQAQPSMGGGGFKPKSFTYGGFTMERQPTEAEYQQERERKGKETKQTKLAEIDATMQPARNILSELKNNYYTAFPSAPQTGKGMARFKYGAGKSMEAFTQENKDVASYLQTRQAFLSLLVRGLGEKGVLTNTDIARVEKAIPSQWTTKNVAEQNFRTIENILNAATQRYVNSGGNLSDIQDVISNAQGNQTAKKQNIPATGQMFNGQKVKSVRRIR